MRVAVAEAAVEVRDLRQHGAHVDDRVGAEVGARAVRGPAAGLDLAQAKPLWATHARSAVGSVTIAASAAAPNRSATERHPALANSSSLTAATRTSPAKPAPAAAAPASRHAASPPFMS